MPHLHANPYGCFGIDGCGMATAQDMGLPFSPHGGFPFTVNTCLDYTGFDCAP